MGVQEEEREKRKKKQNQTQNHPGATLHHITHTIHTHLLFFPLSVVFLMVHE